MIDVETQVVIYRVLCGRGNDSCLCAEEPLREPGRERDGAGEADDC